MKNFTLSAAALLMAFSASAAPADSPVKSFSMPKSTSILGSRNAAPAADRKMPRGAHAHKLPLTSDGRISASRAKATGAKRLAPITDEIVMEQPAGTLSNWSRDCTGWSYFWGMFIDMPVAGAAQQIVEGEDGKVWFNMQASQFPLGDVWTYAEKQEDGSLVVPAGQKIYVEEYAGEAYEFYLVPVTFDYDYDEDDYVFSYYDSLTFLKDGDNYVQEDPDKVLGICEWYEGAFEWTGYGDQAITFRPMTDVPQTIPADVALERWSLMSGIVGYFVNVGFEGDKIYIQGIFDDCPDGVLVGSVDGDKVTFPAGQFQGLSSYWSWSYVYGGNVEEVWDEYWEEYYPEVIVSGDLVFSYDADAKLLVPENVIVSATNRSDNIEEVQVESYIEDAEIKLQHRDPSALPMAPFDLYFYEEFEDYGCNTFDFTVPGVDVNGDLLEPSNLYYRIYFDGEPFIFYGDEYEGLPEEGQELINANFTNYYSIYTSGFAKRIEFYFEGADEVGVQSVYMQPDENGNVVALETEIVTMDLSEVRGIMADAETVSSVWYDLQGRRVSNPSAGLYVRVDTKKDGSRRAVKSVLK